jgi:HAD superfamily hydrolase (TIGR01549 family)
MSRIALVDVDGTLVDSNYQHALAWFRAFRRHDLVFPIWRIHRHIGMGGDQLVPALAGDDVERRLGDKLRAAHGEELEPMLAEIAPVPDAHAFLKALGDNGFRVVLASSGKPDQVDVFLDLIDGRTVAEQWTTSQDVETTKPNPELFQVALGKLQDTDSPPGGDAEVVVVGDSTWDCIAADRLGVRSLALRTGGFARDELIEAGAEQVFDSLAELGDDLIAARL